MITIIMMPLPQPLQSLPESLELSSARPPEADWGRPLGGDRDLTGPNSGEHPG